MAVRHDASPRCATTTRRSISPLRYARRNAALTLDEINRAAIHIGTGDRGESHITLSNGRGGFAVLGMRPAGSFLALDGRRVALAADSTASSK